MTEFCKIICCVFLLLYMTHCKNITEGSTEVIAKENQIVILDTMNIHASYRYGFILTNSSCDTLKIDKITSSCECISMKKNLKYIVPHSQDTLIVTIVPDRKGFISRAVYVYFVNQVSPIDFILEGCVK